MKVTGTDNMLDMKSASKCNIFLFSFFVFVRKPKKDENLSEEAAKVIAGLPDLSFMQAKVLMFPTTLTPLGSQATTD